MSRVSTGNVKPVINTVIILFTSRVVNSKHNKKLAKSVINFNSTQEYKKNVIQLVFQSEIIKR